MTNLAGETPLMRACYFDNCLRSCKCQATRILISHGADVNFVNKAKQSALTFCCIKYRENSLRVLIDNNLSLAALDGEDCAEL